MKTKQIKKEDLDRLREAIEFANRALLGTGDPEVEYAWEKSGEATVSTIVDLGALALDRLEEIEAENGALRRHRARLVRTGDRFIHDHFLNAFNQPQVCRVTSVRHNTVHYRCDEGTGTNGQFKVDKVKLREIVREWL